MDPILAKGNGSAWARTSFQARLSLSQAFTHSADMNWFEDVRNNFTSESLPKTSGWQEFWFSLILVDLARPVLPKGGAPKRAPKPRRTSERAAKAKAKAAGKNKKDK